MKIHLVAALLLLGLMSSARADSVDLEPVTCAQFMTGYDTLSSRPFSAEDGSLTIAMNAIADNHLVLDKTETAYMTREDLAAYISRLKPIDALIWLQTVYLAIEVQLKRCSGTSFVQKRIELRAPSLTPSNQNKKSCGTDTIPDLSKPLTK